MTQAETNRRNRVLNNLNTAMTGMVRQIDQEHENSLLVDTIQQEDPSSDQPEEEIPPHQEDVNHLMEILLVAHQDDLVDPLLGSVVEQIQEAGNSIGLDPFSVNGVVVEEEQMDEEIVAEPEFLLIDQDPISGLPERSSPTEEMENPLDIMECPTPPSLHTLREVAVPICTNSYFQSSMDPDNLISDTNFCDFNRRGSTGDLDSSCEAGEYSGDNQITMLSTQSSGEGNSDQTNSRRNMYLVDPPAGVISSTPTSSSKKKKPKVRKSTRNKNKAAGSQSPTVSQ